jgi:peptidoglycan/LPS O-acetylase OafA/YrhL
MSRKKNSARNVSRPPTPLVDTQGDAPDRWPALTGLRGLAALAVLGMHAFALAGSPASLWPPLAWFLAMGWSGVDVFFTLSAFLLTIPFVEAEKAGQPPPDLRRYGLRRLLRIVPAYYAQIVFLLLLGALGVQSAAAWASPSPGGVLAHALFWINAWPIVPAQVPPWWTLPVEMAFYLLLPLFARCLRAGRWPWLLLIIAASLLYRLAIMQGGLSRMQEVFWVEHLPGRLHQFLIGMLAAYALVRVPAVLQWSRVRLDALGATALGAFLLLPALGYLRGDQAFQGAPVNDALLLAWHLYAAVLVAMLLLVLVAGAPRCNRLLSAVPLQALGWISYSLYLWHYPVLLVLRESMGGLSAVQADFGPFLVQGLLFSTLAAIASWWLVERPTQRWARRATMRG